MVREDRVELERVVHRLHWEDSLLLNLAHPHIVRCYEVLTAPRTLVVLETLPGETLSRLAGRRKQRLVLREVQILGLQLCSAIGYLHHRGILHLDLSVARGIGAPGGPSGTRGYRAPEQLAPDAVGEASDIWGIGVTLFQVLTGVPAWWEGLAPRHPASLSEPFAP